MKLYKLLFHSLFFIQSVGTSASPEFSADNCNVYAKQGIKSKQTKKKGKKKNQVKQYQNKERGLGCYYSRNASGRRTASGKILNCDELVCAHKKYPFGSILRVTNLSNGKTVDVEVVDRGPFGKGRIVDLSWEAARQLGMLSQGVANVIVEKIK